MIVSRKNPHLQKKIKQGVKVRVKDIFTNLILRRKRKLKKDKILFNSYTNADRILRYIDNRENLKTNDELVRHFNTFKYTKKFDDVTNTLLKAQQITICSEADYANINLLTDINENTITK